MSSKRPLKHKEYQKATMATHNYDPPGNVKKLRVNLPSNEQVKMSYLDMLIDKERINSILKVVANQMLIFNSLDRTNYTEIQNVCYKAARANLRESDRTLRQLKKELS